MIKWIGSLFRKPVITSIPHSKLELCFTDSDGRKYYKFPEAMALPLERLGKLQEFMMWMSTSLTSNELDKLVDAGEKALLDFLTNKAKNLSRVGYVFTMMRERKTMCVHTELLYNFLAVQVIREDEAAECFNNAIHLSKIDQFKLETADGKTHDFFLRIGLKKLNDLFNMSEEEWMRFWQESTQDQKVTETILNLMLKDESPDTDKASMSK